MSNERAQRVASRFLEGFGSSHSNYLREETAKAISNRPDSAKVSVLTDVLKDVAQLSGVDPSKSSDMARQIAKEFLSKLNRLKSR